MQTRNLMCLHFLSSRTLTSRIEIVHGELRIPVSYSRIHTNFLKELRFGINFALSKEAGLSIRSREACKRDHVERIN
jgi:hypothetical protein